MEIKVIQIGLHNKTERETQSQQQLQSLTSNYIRIENTPYDKEPPLNSIFNGDKNAYVGLSKEHHEVGLISRHYGCWLGHKQAIQLGFCENEHFLVCEGDCRILDINLFKERLQEAIKVLDEKNYHIVRFEEPYNGVGTTLYNQVSNYLWECDFINCSHCYLVNKNSKNFYDYIYNSIGWTASDWWIQEAFLLNNLKMLCFKEKLTSQFDGFSEIDKINKNYD